MSQPQSRYALLRGLSSRTNSEERRELLRTVTDALSRHPSDAEFAELDGILSAVAQEYSLQVRAEFARLVAASPTRFRDTSEQFALDEIAVAAPVLRHSQTLSEETLLKVAAGKSQAHMLAVTQRGSVSKKVSHALVARGDDAVVTSLLSNEGASIADETYEVVASRAETSPALQGPLVRRRDVPLDLLNGLYQTVEAGLRCEILRKFQAVSATELEKAFERSRTRVTSHYRALPEDFVQARVRVGALEATGKLTQAVLTSLLREGPGGRTTFKLAFARLTDVEFDVVDRAVEAADLDTVALLCRGARFDRALFVALAVGLDKTDRGLAAADAFGDLYESVPIDAAQRALRFWKVRAA